MLTSPCLQLAHSTPILWPPHMQRVDSLEKILMPGDWGQEEKETTEDEMAGWHH